MVKAQIKLSLFDAKRFQLVAILVRKATFCGYINIQDDWLELGRFF